MKIALLGYGKMGKVIERVAQERGHEIILRKKSADSFDGLENADVAIEFSVPSAAVNNINECFTKNIPVVSGTTGWLEHYDEIKKLCNANNGAFLYGSNFSLGVNIFFELNVQLAKMMSKLEQYNVSMEEIHHTQKLDAPSGTAITLAKDIIANSNYNDWTIDTPKENDIFITAKREENVPGTHTVTYDSEVDSIEIKHTAHSREGFALGAVVAAEWLTGKKGVFSMKDVLGI
ncbi:4-hydroxy-tetrahydrodipicolinate reductase [Flavobacterium arcticum]|uniref:4-hydroxy-tetrahydrodipicolinate reductase n=1 Tax=Flavobacterium arcticum TaxID=1784713 RepID=A0A345H8B4_9FLAO|nr:4-hydroxy-tetrahydrodipicolinate reductase [Flavobacterium arcticum]AXG72824.1 4-hydroxy-tetrahydrodipicolinate reductase [Flavobacterium arcticum]KAF2510511.1 4-hydroxy-tetrahydrodipicolinate reductase [Flavobacterium arcticum]